MTGPQYDSANTVHWRQLIAAVRAVYGGKLTYGANAGVEDFTNEIGKIEFWDSLDFIGACAYVKLADDSNASTETMNAKFAAWDQNFIRPVQQRIGKPVVITETGYRSVQGALQDPPNWQMGGGYDEVAQAKAYQVVLQYLRNSAYITGAYIWEWETNPSAGGSGNTGYTPQNKQAQSVMTTVFGGTSTPPATPTFTVQASHGSSVSIGSPVAFQVTVTANAAAQSMLVDVELYSDKGEKVMQKFYENQAFSAQEQKKYDVTWTPGNSGTYSLKVGVFSGGWTTNYLWNNAADTVVVPVTSGGGSTPPPTASVVEIWWPSNGSAVHGVQPFKAIVKDMPLDAYDMYWQVDGDRLNLMQNSNQDYPHKEVLVDLTGWNWKGEGPYVLQFVAKDKNGAILAKQQTSILVK
jgi:hypothetical protein